MTDRDLRYARRATDLLRGARPGAPSNIGDRAATVAALESALRKRGRRSLRRASMTGGLAAVAACALFLMTRELPTDGNRASVPAAPAPAAAKASAPERVDDTPTPVEPSLRPGDRIPATGRELTLALTSGTRLSFARGSDAEVVQIGRVQWFRLRTGRVRADVAPLAAGERFVIATDDVEVEVRGTSFEVSVEEEPGSCASASPTRVSVRKGLVTVRHIDTGEEQQIGAGASWPRGCAVTRGGSAQPRAVRPTVAATRASSRPGTVDAQETPSSLARQNALFAAAVEARRRGDRREAGRKLDQLLAEFPASPLAETARADRRRLCDEADPTP